MTSLGFALEISMKLCGKMTKKKGRGVVGSSARGLRHFMDSWGLLIWVFLEEILLG